MKLPRYNVVAATKMHELAGKQTAGVADPALGATDILFSSPNRTSPLTSWGFFTRTRRAGFAVFTLVRQSFREDFGVLTDTRRNLEGMLRGFQRLMSSAKA